MVTRITQSDVERFKRNDAASYDDVTAAYDDFTQRCTLPIARRLLDQAGLRPGNRVLDVGTGTGVVAWEAVARVAPDGEVVGVDLSEGMLAAARAKAAHRSSGGGQTTVQPRFIKMDAEALDFPNGHFHAVVSLYALAHFPHPDRALMTFFRVLERGGRLAIGVGTAAPFWSLRAWGKRLARLPGMLRSRTGRQLNAPNLLHALLDELLPRASEAEESAWAVAHANRTAVVHRMVREAGFVKVRTEWNARTEIVNSAEEFWNLQVTFSSRARKRLAGASPDAVEEIREKFFERCRRVQSRGGRLAYPYAAYLVWARKP